MPKPEILLESGTNEMEPLVFMLGCELFAVNVAKMQAILQYDPSVVTRVPLAPSAMLGMMPYREHAVPLIDLARTLEASGEGKDPRQIVIVMEFNKFVSSYRVDGVQGIQRLSWKNFEPISDFARSTAGIISGSVHIDGREVLVVDMECILALYAPDLAFRKVDAANKEPQAFHRRADIRLVLVEDSRTIREKTVRCLAEAGYRHIEVFQNGRQAYDWLTSRTGEEGGDAGPDVIISDIEMPSMDGLTLCRRVKEKELLTDVPFIMFSSLINPLMARKCEAVGAERYVAKPETDRLIAMVDEVVSSCGSRPSSSLD